jgi:hypothetical protein
LTQIICHQTGEEAEETMKIKMKDTPYVGNSIACYIRAYPIIVEKKIVPKK